jgi:hypothetical protein
VRGLTGTLDRPWTLSSRDLQYKTIHKSCELGRWGLRTAAGVWWNSDVEKHGMRKAEI